MGFTRKSLAVELSALKVFEKPKILLEQYSTEPEIASGILWDSAMKGEINGKTIADFGTGTGILGFGCMLLGAKKVFFIDKDKDAIHIAKENYNSLLKKYDLSDAKAEFIICEVKEFNEKADMVIENPPFGIKDAHADKAFLEKAFATASLVYSLHKSETKPFIEKISKDNGFKIIEIKRFSFPLKQTMSYHKKKIQLIDVSCFKIKKN